VGAKTSVAESVMSFVCFGPVLSITQQQPYSSVLTSLSIDSHTSGYEMGEKRLGKWALHADDESIKTHQCTQHRKIVPKQGKLVQPEIEKVRGTAKRGWRKSSPAFQSRKKLTPHSFCFDGD
jgi:hypothetical protein